MNSLATTNLDGIIGGYLRMLGLPSATTYVAEYPDRILGSILEAEIKELKETMDADTLFPRENWPRFALEWGVMFGIRAGVAALTCAPPEAIAKISAAVAYTRGEMCDKITNAKRQHEEAARKSKTSANGKGGRKST
jgi:hypothetical protein